MIGLSSEEGVDRGRSTEIEFMAALIVLLAAEIDCPHNFEPPVITLIV